MENLNYNPRATREIVKSGVFASRPFVLLDLGCSGGIDPLWRAFEPHLHAHGFDPRKGECARLQSAEQNPNIRYHANAIGLPAEHEFIRRRDAHEAGGLRYEDTVILRSSMWRPSPPVAAAADPSQTAPPAAEPLSKIALSQFISSESIAYVDFFKIDTDGSDLEALVSLEPALPATAPLGFLVECNYQGSWHDTSNTFHNIDRFMKQHGYMVYGMDVGRFSRAVLPAPYIYSQLAQTRSGQPLQGDVVFLPDFTHSPQATDAGNVLAIAQLLKLICLYELFNVPDCAVELIECRRERIAEVLEPESLLDLLTPQLEGRTVTYREYSEHYRDHHEDLFPRPITVSEPPPPAPPREPERRRGFLKWF